jgi:DNA-binding MarR family transcriptional regulator
LGTRLSSARNPKAASADAARSRSPARKKGKQDVHSVDWELRFGYLIHDVSRLRRSAFDRWIKALNVTRSQWWVVAYLSRQDGMPQTRLAEELDVGKVAMGGLIDRLEKGGLVRRVPDESDRRVKRIFLEPPSKKLITRMRGINHQFNEEILAGVKDGDLETAAVTWHTIKKNLLRYLNGSPEPEPSSAGNESAGQA